MKNDFIVLHARNAQFCIFGAANMEAILLAANELGIAARASSADGKHWTISIA